jgi:hypothetical protein
LERFTAPRANDTRTLVNFESTTGCEWKKLDHQ